MVPGLHLDDARNGLLRLEEVTNFDHQRMREAQRREERRETDQPLSRLLRSKTPLRWEGCASGNHQ
jgi:hypothetical protein